MCSIYRAEFPVVFHFSHIHQEILRYTVQFSADVFLDSSRKRFFLGIKVLPAQPLTPGLLCPIEYTCSPRLDCTPRVYKNKIKKNTFSKNMYKMLKNLQYASLK